MIKQHWAQKVVKKASSIIKAEVLIANRSGQIIASSHTPRIGELHRAARHAIERNLPIEIEGDDVSFWNVQGPGIILPIERHGSVYGALLVSGDPDDIRAYTHLLKLNAEFIVDEELEHTSRFQETLSRTQMLAHLLFNPTVYFQTYQRKNMIERLGLAEEFAVALISTQSTSKSKTTALRDTLEALRLPGDDIIEISPQSYVYIVKSNPNRGKSHSELIEGFEKNVQSDVFKRTLITLGSFTTGVKGLVQSYHEALSLKALLDDLKIQEGLHTYKHYELATICNNIRKFTPDNESSLVANYKKLLHLGEDKYLGETIEAYFRNHGKLVKTANDLFIHRNTLNYRIKKIHEITGWDPNTIDGIVLLRISQLLYEASE
ncbi:sugar diacid recognition domain-containing protein [Staphylococcus lutrae]|uniref:Sugar diacid utilization regulator n=1 Tax=Staphylococcus lutrae TaxID=155085 RepID=A0AAC9WJ44_9STAP|nr:sugar diacid recognition domain-containing protein [Staphylococcus lutrae]ARJ50598.1 sugar diacid utilization regulator [Staphylococcus lutrae]PNZ37526.1 sugar diacid utilization regulator [Staphylococcus lutrae]